jgi:hypothetical protein
MRQYVGYHTMDETWEFCRAHGITWMACATTYRPS